MNNKAAQTMPALPRPYWKAGDVKDDYGNPYNETDLFTDDDMRAMYQQGYAAALAQTAGMVEPLPMDTAPRDGTMVRLLVNFTDHATEDTAGPAWTIGAYPSDNESGGWQFAGWCWTHDHFTEGEGTPIGWLPMLAAAPAASGVDTSTNEAWVERAQEKIAAMDSASGGEDAMAEYTTGHCPNHNQPGGCQLHNLQCGWPNCDRRQVQHQPPPAASVSERARALMAQAYRDGGFPYAAGTLEAGVIDSVDSCALRAIEQALTQQQK